MANKLLNASDFFKGGYNFLAPTDAWEKSDDTILRHRKATRPRSKVQNGGLQRRIFSTIHKQRLGYLMECPNTVITDN